MQGWLGQYGGRTTYGLLRLLHAGLDLLEGILDFILNDIYVLFSNYRD